MPSPKSAHEVERLLATWDAIDTQAGQRAAARREDHLRARGELISEYQFRVEPNDWVHLDWMRPIRFVYRNLPSGVRLTLKKWMSR